MDHEIHRVVGVRIVGDYTLEVEFADGTRQDIDFQPVMAGELYGPLLDQSLFGKVKVDPEVHTLVWPNGADFDPATLHDWPIYQESVLRTGEAVERGPTGRSQFLIRTASSE